MDIFICCWYNPKCTFNPLFSSHFVGRISLFHRNPANLSMTDFLYKNRKLYILPNTFDNCSNKESLLKPDREYNERRR